MPPSIGLGLIGLTVYISCSQHPWLEYHSLHLITKPLFTQPPPHNNIQIAEARRLEIARAIIIPVASNVETQRGNENMRQEEPSVREDRVIGYT